MIDWLTLRTPIDCGLSDHLVDKLMGAACVLVCQDLTSTAGGKPQIIWEKTTYDFEKLRSDMPGLFWTIQNNGTGIPFLVIGGSPASIEHGCNVFGSGDIRHCAQVLVDHARRTLQSWLPQPRDWELCRVDVTHNYALPSNDAVKGALRELLRTDRARRYKAESIKDTDSVGFNYSSDLRGGKAYHKGPQLEFLRSKGKTNATDEQIQLANRLLRLELRLGARWCRRLGEARDSVGGWVKVEKDDPRYRDWWNLSERELDSEHEAFFGGFFGDIEVRDMGNLLQKLELVAPTKGQALAAHRTWALIKSIGHEQAKASMPLRTWQRHCKLLVEAGLSDVDLCSAEIVPFMRVRVSVTEFVTSWDDLRRAA